MRAGRNRGALLILRGEPGREREKEKAENRKQRKAENRKQGRPAGHCSQRGEGRQQKIERNGKLAANKRSETENMRLFFSCPSEKRGTASREITLKKQFQRLVTLQTFDQGDEET